MNTNQSKRSIHIGGNATGSTIVSGDGNSVNSQNSQPASSARKPSRCKILILAANPNTSTRLRLDEEVRDISEGLKRARYRDDFEIVQRWAVRPRDFQRAILEETPQIVHFSGHGEGKVGLHLEDDIGRPHRVTGDALSSLFKLFAQKAHIQCVVLNGCYSQTQAQAIAGYVPHIIGMQQAIGDKAAIEFVVGFYDAIGNGESVEFAFESGKVAMELSDAGYSDAPVLLNCLASS